MGRIIDISSKLTNEPTFITIGEGKMYKVDDSKNTFIKLMSKMDDESTPEIDKLDDVVRCILGNTAFKEIDKMNLSIAQYKTLVSAILAAVNNEDLDKYEARFQEATE